MHVDGEEQTKRRNVRKIIFGIEEWPYNFSKTTAHITNEINK